MKTSELFEKIQDNIMLDLKENEVACPKCKGLRFYYVENNGKAYIETCRECHTGKLYVCEYCGKANKSGCDCKVSADARCKKTEDTRYEKAEKLTPEEYGGWVYSESIGYNEGYFESVSELEEHCADEDIPLPDWVYCCKSQHHKLDIDSAIERMTEDTFEDARDYIVDEQELRGFVDKWNAKQTLVSYYPDYKKVVLLK